MVLNEWRAKQDATFNILKVVAREVFKRYQRSCASWAEPQLEDTAQQKNKAKIETE